MVSDIAIKHFPDEDLTILIARGSVSVSDIVHHASHSYNSNLVLWDLREVASVKLSHGEIEMLSQFMQNLSIPRTKGKTALVADQGNPDFELLYMYKKTMEAAALPIEYQVFTSIQEAKKWLGVAV